MSLKLLTAEGRFECGLAEVVAGKVWAFAPVVPNVPGPLFGLGVAIANEPGYIPIPLHWVHADTYEEAADHADELNRAEGLDDKTAYRIIASTMKSRF